ncbi:MAG: retention module-containing protein, partial [Oceanisphaera sp.]|uniref:retention module-containing protein n=1 Tax=Oceanisphaera sp. TaxID=1929979 RepID=UPI003C742F10
MEQIQQAATVTTLVGKAFILRANGEKVALKQGDILSPGTIIMTEAGAEVMVAGPDFNLALGENSLTEIPTEPLETAQAPTILSSSSDEVSALQAAILEGQDPTLAFEAAGAAAGPDVAGNVNGSGNGGFVQVTRTGDSLIAEAGFDTAISTAPFDNNELLIGEQLNEVPRLGTITLFAPDQITEGGQITISASVDLAPQTDLTITLSNGQQIIIPAGATSGSVSFDSRPDDVYNQGNQNVDVTITGTSGGNYYNLDTSSSTTTTIVDDSDVTTVTLSVPDTVTEGQPITVIATVNNAPQTDLILTLSNGEQIVIAAGELSGQVSFDSRADDAYLQGDEPLDISITQSEGGNFESLDTSATASTTIVDDADITSLTLGDIMVSEGSGSATVTGVLSNPAGQAFTVTLSNGATLSFAVGATEATSSAFAIQDDDVYVDGEQITVTVTDQGDHDFEQLVSNSATVTVEDTTDVVTATLSVDNATANEGAGDLTYTVTLQDAAGQPVNANNDVTVTLASGNTVTILANTSSITFSQAVQGDDVYVDGETVSQAITGVSEAGAGTPGSFENLTFNGTAVDTVISDTEDNTYLSFGEIQILENGLARIEGFLNNPAGENFTVELSNGAILEFIEGESVAVSGSFSLNNENITVVGLGAHNFEKLVVSQAVISEEDSENIKIVLPIADGESGIITSLPNDGVLTVDGQVVTQQMIDAGLTVSSTDKVDFTPTPDFSGDVAFDYKVVDEHDNVISGNEGITLNVKVLPITDIPEVTLIIGSAENQIQHINISNVNVGASDKNFEVTAFSNGAPGTISRIEYDPNVGQGNVNGFGVSGKANPNNNSNAEKEIDSHEVIRVDFDQPDTDLSVTFSWLAKSEQAKYTLYDNNGNVLGSEVVTGKTEKIDDPYNISDKFPDAQISRVEFTA